MDERELTALDRTERLEYLQQVFRDAANPNYQPESEFNHDYFRRGGCLRNCLAEIDQLAGESEYDQHIDEARQNYMDIVLTRPNWRNRHERKIHLQATEAAYIDAVIDKLAAVVDARTPDDMLELRQMPTLVEKTSFSEHPIPLKDVAANHLFVLMDTALQEHAQRREIISVHNTANFRARVVGSRALHLGIAAGLFAASFVPELGVVPTPDEFITHDIETTLKVTSAIIFGLDAPELVRLQYLQRKHDAQAKRLNKQLAANQELSDMALRISYGSTRYGSSAGPHQFTDRFGTDNPIENVRRLEKMDTLFEGLHGDPGGRPYTGAQAIGYAARFLLERIEQVKLLGNPEMAAATPRDRYLQLSRDILTEDLTRMKKGLTITRYRKEMMKVIGAVPAFAFSSLMATAADAESASEDIVRTISPASSRPPEKSRTYSE